MQNLSWDASQWYNIKKLKNKSLILMLHTPFLIKDIILNL
jgi:hypothetical protein